MKKQKINKIREAAKKRAAAMAKERAKTRQQNLHRVENKKSPYRRKESLHKSGPATDAEIAQKFGVRKVSFGDQSTVERKGSLHSSSPGLLYSPSKTKSPEKKKKGSVHDAFEAYHRDRSGSGDQQRKDSAVVWLPDIAVSTCMSCAVDFDWLTRKHHCRACGRIYCNKCSSKRCLLPPDYNYRDQQRVCNQCFTELQPYQATLSVTVANRMKSNYIDVHGPRRYFNSPLVFTLGHAVRNAAYSLENMMEDNNVPLDQMIPKALFERAQGIAFFTVLKAGFLITARVGTGLLVAKLPNGEWSAPSALGTAGIGAGAQVGGEWTDHILILTTKKAVRAMGAGNKDGGAMFTVGATAGLSVGIGRSLQSDFFDGDTNTKPEQKDKKKNETDVYGMKKQTENSALASSAANATKDKEGSIQTVYTISNSKGVFAGVSLELNGIKARPDVNAKFYGAQFHVDDILGFTSNPVERPPAAKPLYKSLQKYSEFLKSK